MLKKRVISAAIGIPFVVAAIWFGQPWFTILMAVWGLLAAFEFYRMVSAAQIAPLTAFGLLWTLLFIISPHFDLPYLTPALLTSAVMLPLIWLIFRRQKESAFATWAWTLAGILYLGWLLSHTVALRYLDNGRDWVFMALFLTFASDTSAFFVGRKIGRLKLAPQISPGKTWEGAIGGLFSSIIASLILVMILRMDISFIQAVILGVLVSVFAQFGDLVESLLKRNMGAKDAGTWVPGHGGFLDRIDSVIFAGVVVYYYALFV